MKKLILSTLLASCLWLGACTPPAWFTTVEGIAKVAAPIAGTIVDVVDPALIPLVAAVEGAFTALVDTVDTYKASPTAGNLQAVEAAFNAVETNEAALSAAAQIKNPATDQKVAQVVELLNQAVTEIVGLVPAPAAAQLKLKAPGSAKGLTSKDFKKQFNSIVSGDKRFKKFIVL
jgi:hypothetical protein